MWAILKRALIRLTGKLDSFYRGEAEKLELAGSPAEISRWKRRSTASLIVITAILAAVGVAVVLVILLKGT